MSRSPSTEPVNPNSPPSPPPPQTKVSALFKSPEPSPLSTSGPSPSPSPPPGDDTAAPSWSTAEQGDPAGPPPASGDTPSTGSAVRVSKAGLRAGIGTGFRQVCRLLAAFVADEQERELGVWAPDAEDVDDIARPATNIVYRRLPDEAKGGDVIDLFALGLAVAGYLGKSLSRRAQVRAHRELLAAQGEPSS